MRSLLLLCTLVALVAAAPADDLQRQIDQAKDELRQATERLDRVNDRVRAAEDRADALRRRANLIAADADRLNAEAARLERDRASALAALPRLQQQYESSGRAIPALKDKLDASKGAEQTIVQAAAQRVATMEAEFKTSDAIQAAQRRIAEIQSQLDLRLAEVQKTLAGDPTYSALRQEADRLKIEVDALRKTSGADAALLAKSSQTWMAAETRAGEMLKKAESGDELHKALRQKAADARKAEKKLYDDFELSKRDDPALRQLAADGQAAVAAVRLVHNELGRAETERSSAEFRLREVTTLIATADDQAAAARLRAQSLRNDYDNTMRELELAQLERRRAEGECQDAERIVRAAAEKLRKLIEQEKPRG